MSTPSSFENPDSTIFGYVPEDELAPVIRKSPRTLQRWRRLGEGPPHTKIGRTVYYNLEAVRKWLASSERGA